MAGNFVEVLPDNTGKKVEAVQAVNDTDTVYEQVVQWPDNGQRMIYNTLSLILGELRESRRVLCEVSRVNFEELQGEY